MKTSIFDATFTLPPLIEMTEVEKDMPLPPPSHLDPAGRCRMMVDHDC